ncbi:MAG: hypothetical protein ABJE10_16820 [bacterium]
MLRLNLICSLLAGFGLTSACGSSAITQQTPKVLRYSGTINQPAGNGFLVYKIGGAWTLNADGSFATGTDTVQILDARVYGQSGTATMTLKTTCAAIVGKEAWAEQEVLTSTDPVGLPVGTKSVMHLSSTSGTPKGGGGPSAAWYPTGNICVDRPAAIPAFDMQNGVLTFP